MKATTSRLARAVFSLSLVAGLFTSSPQAAFAQAAHAAGTTGAPQTAQSVGLTGGVAMFGGQDSGALNVFGPNGKSQGKCPLKHTSVSAKISGYVSRVTVKQQFHNPFKDKIEAIYTFPLSETGAVDEMLMKVGNRTIHGTIKKREEARQIYETARDRGQTASLLDQERTNIFTQSVANIKPGEDIEITINYVDLLPYEAGSYTFAFPMVVGPRFIPGTPTLNPNSHPGTGTAPDTTKVPDASKITPPVAPEGERAGHDLSLDVTIDSGIPISDVQSKLHDVNITRPAGDKAVISLKNKNTIPNKDFVLTWNVAGDQLKSGYLTHNNGKSGFFTLMVLPPKKVTPDKVQPKEMVFLIDCSGSQSGQPLQKCKETMLYILDHMNPNDTFQVITFNNTATELFAKPQVATEEMKTKAQAFIKSLEARGGTWMAPAVEKACAIPTDEHRLRIVTFMTDGYVGNDFEVIGLVKKLRGNSRWFPFGTGNSVNRMLIDGIAREGGGESEYVLLNSPGDVVGAKFYKRIASPVLTDVKLDFGGLKTKEVFPHDISDVWAERPLYIKGRYTEPGKGTVTISGYSGGKPYKQTLNVDFPEKQPSNPVLASLWARAKVDRLMSEDWFGAQSGSVNKELKDDIVKTALDYHIMTQYTSFVAVEETTINDGGKPRTITVPVELPDGVSREGIFGEADKKDFGGKVAMRRTRGYMMSNSLPSAYMAKSVAPVPMRMGGGGGAAAAGATYASPGSTAVSGVGYRGDTGRVSSRLQEKAKFYNAPRQIQIVDQSPVVRDYRSASDEEVRFDVQHNKLHSLLVGLAKKYSGKPIAGLDIKDGKVLIQVWLRDTSEKALAELKKAGLEISFESSTTKLVVGRVDVNKLEALAKLTTVVSIEPPKDN